jgi:flagellar motor switch protein FliM
MIQRVVQIVFEHMEKAWEPVEPIKIELERSEVNPQFVGIVPPSDIVVVTPFEIEMDEARGNITVCVPYSTFEPIRSKLVGAFQSERLELDHNWVRRMMLQIEDVQVEACVELGSTEITLRALLELQKGDIIRLDQDSEAELVVRVEGVPKFMGFPRVVKQKKAVEITSRILAPEEEEHE